VKTGEIAGVLIGAHDSARLIEPIADSDPSFDVDAAYAVLFEITRRRTAAGWKPVGRKIGFTNRTLWEPYRVDRPMWAHLYDRTVHRASGGEASVAVGGFVQPRIEPEVVFGLRAPVPVNGRVSDVLDAVEWIAAGFEVVQCNFPDWRFRAPDCTAASGLHGALVVGTPSTLDDDDRDRLTTVLTDFELTLQRDGEVVAHGHGRDVLDSPALALEHLAGVVAGQPDAQPLAAGETITTGTLTDAQPIETGQRWKADYGDLDLEPFELEIR